jgi:PPM family protein phosphatase
MGVRLEAAVRTHPGLVRTSNEDAALATPRLVAVADGVGGHAAGEVASRIAIDALAGLEKRRITGSLAEELAAAVGEGNARVGFTAQARPQLAGMATTVTAVAADDGLLVASVGDSRAYLLRGGRLEQLTRDDSLVQELVDGGHLTPEQAREHPQRSVVTAALDGRSGLEPAVGHYDARPGDRVLLCSDGLSDLVDAETIAGTLQVADREEAADALVRLALEAGGRDNVTVVIADVADDPEGSAAWG